MMLEVDNISKDLERNGQLSVNGLIALKQDVDQWAHSLETTDVEYARKKKEERKEKERELKQREEERKQRAEEEEKKRKQKEEERKKKAAEDEKRRKVEEVKHKDMEAKKKEEDDKKQREIEAKKKEDEERQRKEREEKQAREKEKEERRRREREEAERRKNWRNWPPMIFYRDDDTTAFHKGVVCIALAMEGELVKEDLTCVGSDGNNEREKCLQAEKKEVPMSSLVTIKPSTKPAIRLQEPLHLFIPHQANQSSRDIVVKVSLDGGPWKTTEYEVAIPPSVNITDVHMVHIAIHNFKSVGILVASRPKFHAFAVGKEGGTFEIKSPLKARLTVPKDCFNEKTNGTLQITDKKHTNAMAKDVKDLRNIQLALAPHNITFEKKSKTNVSLEIYPDLHRIKETDDKVALLSSKNHQGWSVVDFEKVKDKSGACLFTLPPDGKSFSVIGLVVPKSFKDSELSRLAELFYVSSEQFRMRLILKQHKENKRRLAIRCMNPELFSSSVAELRSQGFTDGPSECVEFSVKEGETIWLQLMGNRKFASQQSSEVHFKVYMSAIYTMDILVSETKGKDNSSRYKNDLQYNVGLIEQKPPRHGVFKLQL